MDTKEWLKRVREQYADERKSFVSGLLSMTANNSYLRKVSDGLNGLVITVGDEVLYITKEAHSFCKGTVTGFDEKGFTIFIDDNPVSVMDGRDIAGLRFLALRSEIQNAPE